MIEGNRIFFLIAIGGQILCRIVSMDAVRRASSRTSVPVVRYGVGIRRPLRIKRLIPQSCSGNTLYCRSCQTGIPIPASKRIACPCRRRQRQTHAIGIACILVFVRNRPIVFIVGYGIFPFCYQISLTGRQPICVGNKLIMLPIRTALDYNLVIRHFTVAVLNSVDNA